MNFNTAGVRQFLMDSFSDEELTTLCFDFFPEVHNSFASGMSKGQKVQLLIEYVQHLEQWPDLLKVLQQQRPVQYAKRFGSAEAAPVTQPRPASPVPRVQSHADSSRALRVFLCHASGDKPAVRELYQRLHTDGIDAWLDEEDLLPGQDWQRAIPKAVRDSDVVLVCLSRNSINKAGYVQKEIKFALDVADEQPEDTIFLIPLKLEECKVPERLSRWQWVNLFHPNGYERLMRALRVRATSLGLDASPTQPSVAPVPHSISGAAPAQPVPTVSGGVNLEGQQGSVGKDVVGRDKIIQAGTYIEHATIVPSAPSPQGAGAAAQPERKADVQLWGGVEFVRIPAGKFLMGSKDDNQFASDDERPQHTVEIPYDYWMARYPVTNEQFAKFVEEAAYRFRPEINRKKADYPMVNVTWYDAMAYCTWWSKVLLVGGDLGELRMRLPTEAEWEKAARGEYGNEWPWGDEFDKNKCNSFEGGKHRTTSVGAYSPQGDSPYGVADMVGNVWEWCHSLSKPYPCAMGDGREDESASGVRVLRGASFNDYQRIARCAARNNAVDDSRLYSFGFRVVVAPALA
jgi:formylglycine-generating enzyme required for sulfatase activity